MDHLPALASWCHIAPEQVPDLTPAELAKFIAWLPRRSAQPVPADPTARRFGPRRG